MIPPIYLMIILTIFVFSSIIVMIRRHHDLHAMAFLTLYVYTIFAQIGYAYFPEISILLGAYFGPDIFYSYWLFMFLSFVLTFLIYLKTDPLNSVKVFYRVRPSNLKLGRSIFFVINILLYFGLNLYFLQNRHLFGWGGGSPMGSMWFVIFFRMFTVCTFLLYVLFRSKFVERMVRIWSIFLFLLNLFFYLSVTSAAGTRSDILYFFIAITFYELSPIIYSLKYQRKKIIAFLLAGFVLLNFLMILLSLRTKMSNITLSSFLQYEREAESSSDESIATKILLQDYYSPSHTLFISMHYKIIDPVEVVKSNFANSLVLFKYPFLTETITSRVDSRTDRGSSWANHYFVEGYNAVGWFGIFYNAIFWNLGMSFWCSVARSDNKFHNRAILSVIILLLVNTMRSQTGAFVQTFWMILIPALGLLLLSSNSRIAILRRTNE